MVDRIKLAALVGELREVSKEQFRIDTELKWLLREPQELEELSEDERAAVRKGLESGLTTNTYGYSEQRAAKELLKCLGN